MRFTASQQDRELNYAGVTVTQTAVRARHISKMVKKKTLTNTVVKNYF